MREDLKKRKQTMAKSKRSTKEPEVEFMGVSPELLQMAQESEEERQQIAMRDKKKIEAEMFA